MEQLSPLKVFYSDKRFVETRVARESLTRAPVCTANLSKISALELFSVLKQVLKPVNRVCYSKIREVSKEHAQQKSRAACCRGFSPRVNKLTTRADKPRELFRKR